MIEWAVENSATVPRQPDSCEAHREARENWGYRAGGSVADSQTIVLARLANQHGHDAEVIQEWGCWERSLGGHLRSPQLELTLFYSGGVGSRSPGEQRTTSS